MNKEKILKLADLLDEQEHADPGVKEEGLFFNMGVYVSHDDDSTRSCGTTACIAGWAVIMERGLEEAVKIPWYEIPVEAQKILDIDGKRVDNIYNSESTAAKLFCMRGTYCSLEEVMPQQAARVLRHLAETGEVDWSVAIGEKNSV